MNRIVVALLLAVLPPGILAATVYKSVDADGTVRFSDKPPGPDEEVEIIEIHHRAPVSVPDSEQLVAEMAATTERLREDRLRREAERAPAPRSTATITSDEYEQPTTLQPWYYLGPYRHGYGHNHRDWHRDHHRPPPDRRNERDRRREEMGGTWYIPKRLPGLGDTHSGR